MCVAQQERNGVEMDLEGHVLFRISALDNKKRKESLKRSSDQCHG